MKRIIICRMMMLIIVGTMSSVCLSQPALHFVSLVDSAQKYSNEGKWAEASGLWQKIVLQNPTNAQFWGELANANQNNKNYRASNDAYKKQFELHGELVPIIAYNIACNYALLGEKKEAMNWLQKAFDLGFTRPAHARTDSDLQSLRNDPQFRKLVGLIDPLNVTREEGWNFDLDMLEYEIKRKSYKGSEKFQPDEVYGRIAEVRRKINSLSDEQIVVELLKIMVKVGDGHSWLSPPGNREAYQLTLPIHFYWFEEGMYIIFADPKYQQFLGSKVLQFGDKTLDEVRTALDPLIPRDNNTAINQRVPYLVRHTPLLQTLGLIPARDRVDIKIQDRAGAIKTVTVKADTTQPNIWNVRPYPTGWVSLAHVTPASTPLYLKNMNTNFWYEYIQKDKAMYCQINRIRNDPKETLAAFAERLLRSVNESGADKLIIDLRWNNGGNTGLIMPLINAVLRNEKINQRGNFYVIIGRRTYSAAQNLATYFEKFTNVIFVGEPSGSSPNFVGEEDPITLPYSQITVNVSDLLWQSSWPWDKRTWIAPLIYTPPTFKSFSMNKDDALDAILEYKPIPAIKRSF